MSGLQNNTKISQWLFEIIHIIRIEMHMDRPDKSENILDIILTIYVYASSLISQLKDLKTNIFLKSPPIIEHNAAGNDLLYKVNNPLKRLFGHGFF